MLRRRLLSLAPSLAAASLTPALLSRAHAQEGAIVIGCSAPLTGPLASAGISIKNATEATMANINAKGGVNGRKLKLQMMDDGYVPARTVDNIKSMIADPNVMAFQTCVGTANNAATLGMIEAAGMASLAPLTGASSLRKPGIRNVFHIRASYSEEAVRLVQSLASMGLKDVALIYLDNPYGLEFLGDVRRALQALGLKAAAEVPVAFDGKNVEQAVAAALAVKPSVVLMGTAGAVSGTVISAIKKNSPGMPIASISVVLTPQVAKALGTAGTGMALTMVLPDHNSGKVPVVREYQAMMRASGVDDISGTSLESYINTRVMAHAIERAGRGDLTRIKLRNSFASMAKLDLGGFVVDFPSAAPYTGSHFVDLGVLGSSGRLIG